MIFLDETKINKFSSYKRVWYWTHDPKELLERIALPTIKHNGSFVIIWG